MVLWARLPRSGLGRKPQRKARVAAFLGQSSWPQLHRAAGEWTQRWTVSRLCPPTFRRINPSKTLRKSWGVARAGRGCCHWLHGTGGCAGSARLLGRGQPRAGRAQWVTSIQLLQPPGQCLSRRGHRKARSFSASPMWVQGQPPGSPPLLSRPSAGSWRGSGTART